MSEYVSLFFEHPRQFISLAAVAAVWVGLAALGRLANAGRLYPELTPILGWSIASGMLTMAGVYTDLPLRWVVAALMVVALLTTLQSIRRDPWLVTPAFLKMIVLAAPLLILTSAMIGSQWDEFADWLISPKYLLVHDVIPGLGHPPSGASLAAYPYGWHIVGYLAGLAGGGDLIENAGSLINVLLLLSLGHAALRLAGAEKAETMPWWMAGLAVGAATALNTAFVQKIVLTSYADVATSVSLAAAAIFGWSMLGDLAAGRSAAARRAAICLALVLMLLVNLKQSTFELYGLLLIGLSVAGVRDSRISLRSLVAHLALSAAPAALLYLMWRGYVAAELSGREFIIRPITEWYWDILPEVLRKAGWVLLKKSYYLVVMLAAVVVGLRALRRCHTVLDRAAITVGAIFLGHIAFLIFCYLAAFGRGEAVNVASFWRYNQQLAGLGICFATLCVGEGWRRWGHLATALGLSARRAGTLTMCLVVAAPVLFAEKLRFDKLPYIRHYRLVAMEAKPLLGPEEPVSVLDPAGSGESAIIFSYDALPLGRRASYLGLYHDTSAAGIRRFWDATPVGKIMLHSVPPAVREILGDELQPEMSYLLDKHADGSFAIVKSWRYPPGFHAR
ncbi:MAG: hypothetical protein O2944_08635 [Proteobacteria bacterium]|nr:hypothetical protein [Pseudomonadota bacterium]